MSSTPLGISSPGISAPGVPYSGTDLSIANPFLSLLADSQSIRTYLFYAQPYDPITRQRVNVKISSDGFGSDSVDSLPDGTSANHWFFSSGLVTPYNASNDVMQNGVISAGGGSNQVKSSESVSSQDLSSIMQIDLTIENVSGRFRSLLRYEWDQAPCQILLGRPEFKLSEFTTLFSGVCGAINQLDTSLIHILLLDYSYLLQKPLQNSMYTGMGTALRGEGSTTFGSATVSCPTEDMTLELYIRPKTVATTVRYLAGWRNGVAGAGKFVLRFDSGSNNGLVFRVTDDAGTEFLVHGSMLTTPLHRVHIAAVRSVSSGKILIYVDGELINQTSILGTFTASLSNFTTLREPDTSIGFLDADIDEIRLWNVARTIDQIRDNKDREQIVGIANLVRYWKHNEGTGSIAFESISGGSTIADLTYSGTVKWVGSLEGGSDIQGQAPPVYEGVNREVNPVLVDSQNHVYEISRSTDVGVTVSDVKDKGSSSGITIDAPISDIYDWTPVVGHCITSYQDGRTLLRLERAPEGTLTCKITGPVLDAAGIVKRLFTIYGGVDLSRLDLVAFNTTSLNYPQIVGDGIRLDSSTTIWQLAQRIMYKSGGWVTVTRFGLITVKIISEPSIPKFKLTERDIAANSVSIIARTIASKRTNLGYRFYQTVQQGTALSTSLTEIEKSDLSQSYRYTPTPVDQNIISIRPAAIDLIQLTCYDDPVEVLTEAERRQSIWGKNRITVLLPLTKGLFQYDIGDEIEVSIADLTGGYVLNLFSAILMVCGYQEDPSVDSINLKAWGVEPPIYLETAEGEVLETSEGDGILI